MKGTKKGISWAVALIFLMQTVSSEMMLAIDMTAHSNGSFEISRMKVAPGKPSVYVPPGNYIIKIADEKGNIITEEKMGVSFYLLTNPPTHVNKTGLYVKFPYNRNMTSMKIYYGSRLMFSENLDLCKRDGRCDTKRESILTCPEECKPEEKDGICLPLGGACDPDCPEEQRQGCLQGQTTPTTLTIMHQTTPKFPENGGRSNNDYSLYLLIFLLAVVLVLGFLFYKKRQDQKLQKQRSDFLRWKVEQEKLKDAGKPSA